MEIRLHPKEMETLAIVAKALASRKKAAEEQAQVAAKKADAAAAEAREYFKKLAEICPLVELPADLFASAVFAKVCHFVERIHNLGVDKFPNVLKSSITADVDGVAFINALIAEDAAERNQPFEDIAKASSEFRGKEIKR